MDNWIGTDNVLKEDERDSKRAAGERKHRFVKVFLRLLLGGLQMPSVIREIVCGFLDCGLTAAKLHW